ncbi:heavy-metal-associated domain-containing protein [Limosilactobacillus gastricus]|uniref:heavy-metal-associated domain-containing protein n=1 Tax=Limosilactobacillus gastricus TaxID=227942 RepID=UPI0026F25005|nr:cation transporter [Limosilactobacillus gastricus]
MKKVTLKLAGMTCPSCMTKIQTAVSQQKGVQDVKVLFNAEKVKTTIDEGIISAEQISQVVSQLGYSVEKITVKEA